MDTGRWYTQYVDYAVSYGLFNGTAKDAFDPGGDMNRAMFVQVLANISGVECDKNAHSGFADVPAGKWYTGAVAWAAENKIVNGMSPTDFDPLRSVTREQICTMLVRYSEHIGIPIQKAADKKVFCRRRKDFQFCKGSGLPLSAVSYHRRNRRLQLCSQGHGNPCSGGKNSVGLPYAVSVINKF